MKELFFINDGQKLQKDNKRLITIISGLLLRNGIRMTGHDIMKINFFKPIGTEKHLKCKLYTIEWW